MDGWVKISDSGRILLEGSRIHVKINGRFVTMFRCDGKLYAIDSICHHAGGPLTLGGVRDIEELGVKAISCPWHNFLVTIDGGLKVYQSVDIVSGKPMVGEWKVGKQVQRSHSVIENSDGIFLVCFLTLANFYMVLKRIGTEPGAVASDKDSCSALCAKSFPIYCEVSNF